MISRRKFLAVGLCWVFCQSMVIAQDTPPGYLGRTKEYRNQKSALFGSGTNVNTGVERTTTAFLPVDDTNSTSVVAVPQTETITTNAVTATNPNGVFVPPSSSVTFTVPSKNDMKIRSMRVQTIIKSTFPLQTVTLSVSKDTIPPLVLGLSGTTTLGSVGGHIATLTFDQDSLSDIGAYIPMQEFTADVTFTGKLLGGANYSTFTNQAATGTWSVTMTSSANPGGSNFFQGFTITLISDSVGAVTFNGKTVNLTPRKISEKNPTKMGPGGTTIKVPTRRESEK